MSNSENASSRRREASKGLSTRDVSVADEWYFDNVILTRDSTKIAEALR